MGLGGGGTSYITDYESIFTNPANLHIRERNYKLQITLLESGIYFDSPLSVRNAADRISLFEQTQRTPQEQSFRFINDDREQLLNRYYSRNQTDRQFKSATTINWLGLKWYGEKRSYGLGLRTRQSSRYIIGRGHYDLTPVEEGDMEVIDRSLLHQFQTLHELSFGYSESFTFLSGLFPRTSEFIIGIAPKLVAAGPHFSTNYQSRFSRMDAGSDWAREQSYSTESTGIFSRYAKQQAIGGNPIPQFGSIQNVDQILEPSGVGFGVDLGVTYLFTFGGDLSLIRRGEEPTEKSLRISASITDLGLVYYFDDPYRAKTPGSEAEFADPVVVSDTYYAGALLQDYSFLQNGGVHPLETVTSEDQGNYQSILPASLQTGVLFQINRIKMMGDFRLGLTENAFHSTKLTTYIGTEIRPLPFLPLRAGTRLATDLPGYYSFGAGLETTYFDLNAAVQFRSTASGPTLEPVAASAVALKFYIP